MHDLTTQPSDLHATDACLTSHVLDASFGRPASGMDLLFYRMQGDPPEMISKRAIRFWVMCLLSLISKTRQHIIMCHWFCLNLAFPRIGARRPIVRQLAEHLP